MKIFMTIFFLTFSFISSAKVVPCGNEGSITSRIKDCAEKSKDERPWWKPQPKRNFILVSRNSDLSGIYMDKKTSLIWSTSINVYATLKEAEAICQSGRSELGNISKIKWRIPTKKEFQIAAKNNFLKEMTNRYNMENPHEANHPAYWTTTTGNRYFLVSLYHTQNGKFYYADRDYDKFQVRCVGEI